MDLENLTYEQCIEAFTRCWTEGDIELGCALADLSVAMEDSDFWAQVEAELAIGELLIMKRGLGMDTFKVGDVVETTLGDEHFVGVVTEVHAEDGTITVHAGNELLAHFDSKWFVAVRP